MLIIFDLDDTLIDTAGFIAPFQLKKAFAFLKIPPPLGFEILCQQAKTSQEYLRKVALDFSIDEEEIKVAEKILTSPLPDDFSIPLTPHAREVLSFCKGRATLALVTAGEERFQTEKVKKAGLDPSFFSMIRISKENQKKTCYEEAKERFGEDPRRTWVCGDRIERDLVPARDLGFRTFHFRWGRGAFEPYFDWIEKASGDLRELKDVVK